MGGCQHGVRGSAKNRYLSKTSLMRSLLLKARKTASVPLARTWLIVVEKERNKGIVWDVTDLNR